MNDKRLRPDYIFETSWEVCNKVGGIHTVVCTKARLLQQEWGEHLIMIGPDLQTGSGINPEFTEDKSLFPTWKVKMLEEGLPIRTGRWNIPGSPMVVLVDFTPFFRQKNEIFTNLWVRHHLDSLHGQWDYIEPALFGYAAGKAIACFYNCHLNSTDKIIAQFHEWMTGAGILFLEAHVPQIATVFTTHATVIGRAIAGNGQPFYSRFNSIDAEKAAQELNLASKHSLERIAAVTADCFTCVSEFTARECEHFLGKRPDFITPNGFDASFIPEPALFAVKRSTAREKICKVAAALLQQPVPENSLLVIKSGRYEFRNKGIDLFIDSLALLSKDTSLNRTVLALVFVPAHHTGPRKLLEDSLLQPSLSQPRTGEVLTHNLQGGDNDPILNRIRQQKLDNSPGSRVKILFVPTYLNGTDGVFNMPYYDVLIGFDLAVFPSYYEPWGYTPLESLAFHIPAVTTTVSGFGATVQQLPDYTGKGIMVVERNDENEKQVVVQIAGIIRDYAALSDEEVKKSRESAAEISRKFLWDNLLYRYKMAYDFALQKTLQREELFRSKPQAEPVTVYNNQEEAPVWRTIQVQPALPLTLQALQKLSANLWWSWNTDARTLFAYIDPQRWDLCRGNPLALLKELNLSAIRKLEQDAVFLHMLASVEQSFDSYMQAGESRKSPLTAYCCMEYGLLSGLRLYAGGLGVLAGDYLKAASDSNMNLVAIGLLYRQGYFKQKISAQYEQLALPDIEEPDLLPVYPVNNEKGGQLIIQLAFPGRSVHAGVWKIAVGRVSLYLLDTDLALNQADDRLITAQLYSSDPDMRLKQEILLGIGGVRMLAALGIKPDIYHINEGHAAFSGLERICNIVQQEHLSFEEAMEIIKTTTQFTTHTAEPAAIDRFDEEQLRAYLAYLPRDLNISWAQMMALGRGDIHNEAEKFSMLYLACRQAQEINAVSKLHRQISCRLLNPLWKDLRPAELPLGSITNGVHAPTWMAEKWRQRSESDLPDSAVWEIHLSLKKQLVRTIRERLHARLTALHENPVKALQQLRDINEQSFFIGFSRRFAPYKRAQLIFSDMQRLINIVNNEKRPVQIIIAGKAHPKDERGLAIMRQVVTSCATPGLRNRVLFLEDYDMELAAMLVQGVDLWLNTPRRGKEASGTSGMKAALNRVLNLSVKDGWWAEAFQEGTGWALEADNTYDTEELQDQQDADLLYSMLENEIIPLFFERNQAGLPEKWVARMKASFAAFGRAFNMERVVAEYKAVYEKLHNRCLLLKENHYRLLEELVAWKKMILANWSQIHVMEMQLPAADMPVQTLGEELPVKVVLYIGELPVSDIGLEIVFSSRSSADDYTFVYELAATAVEASRVTYEGKVPLTLSGAYAYSFRVFPKNELLLQRQDFSLIMWI
jgi:phosphorylase/glycogen(starch) synthase